MKKILFAALLSTIFCGCFLFSNDGELLYQQGRYSIRKKNLVSYYNASPDLFVQTVKGDIKINLNGFSKRLIPQEKISTVSIAAINADSISIHFTTKDSFAKIKEEWIIVNVTKVIDSIAIKKQR
ncbi:hypothetical protein BH10BAC2_BH10BAC2_38040 [soil metagenome]